MDAELGEKVNALASQVTDWEDFFTTAAENYSIPYSHKCLRMYAASTVPQKELDRMSKVAKTSHMATLRVAAAQASFHKTCIAPLQPKYAYLKGIALTSQFGQNISDRYCRDVDIVVHKSDFTNVIHKAVQVGYRVMLQDNPLIFASTQKDIDFVIKHTDVVTLVGSDRIPIEVHRRIGTLSLSFDLEHAFETTETIDLFGTQVRTLSKAFHFVYACYHHSRHFWSRLHWVSDLTMMADWARQNIEQVRTIANSIGIMPTIQACLDFQALAAAPDEWTKPNSPTDGGALFLKACLLNLRSDLEFEKALRRQRELGEFMWSWQVSPEQIPRLRKALGKRRYRPSVARHLKRQYPSFLHWIYRLEAVFGAVKTNKSVDQISNASNRENSLINASHSGTKRTGMN
ncbi:MAG: nucleotidyltransferase family protein [Pseudomonadota bacterium]